MSSSLSSIRATRPGGFGYRSATLSIALLAAAAVAYLAALEIAARVLYPAHSALAARIRSDWSAARQSGVSPLPDRRSFLLVGNSLLQAGVDRKELKVLQESDNLNVTLMPIENTNYLDWYFGVRRLLAEGSRPEFVVLCLVPGQLISDGTDGEFFARNLMLPTDILRVKQAARLDWTTTSTYLMASASAWMGNSAEIRNWIRAETVPGMAKLAPVFPEPVITPRAADSVEEIAGRRLTEFAAMCATRGCKVLLLIPPVMRQPQNESLAAVRRAGHAAGVPVLTPVAPAELGPSYFSDGFHLNPRGAVIFSSRLVEALQAISHN
jgi:hypothetical protein